MAHPDDVNSAHVSILTQAQEVIAAHLAHANRDPSMSATSVAIRPAPSHPEVMSQEKKHVERLRELHAKAAGQKDFSR